MQLGECFSLTPFKPALRCQPKTFISILESTSDASILESMQASHSPLFFGGELTNDGIIHILLLKFLQKKKSTNTSPASHILTLSFLQPLQSVIPYPSSTRSLPHSKPNYLCRQCYCRFFTLCGTVCIFLKNMTMRLMIFSSFPQRFRCFLLF